ncbi:MAG: hypothetical protein KDK97_21440 [Verrucomicrobiales bacterium]|nr:hypothetical protein [Verrucomicrobiales bacterium]MCP5560985.1 hypothetical protein [Verrucomicrobiaceae bacterium]
MSAVYRVPLETDLAYLDQKMGEGESALVLKACVRICHGLAKGDDLTADLLKVVMSALTHPQPTVWGPAYAWLQPLLPRVEGLWAAVRGTVGGCGHDDETAPAALAGLARSRGG